MYFIPYERESSICQLLYSRAYHVSDFALHIYENTLIPSLYVPWYDDFAFVKTDEMAFGNKSFGL